MPKQAPPTGNITLRAPVELIDRIDEAAKRVGKTRTQYVLEWLPHYWEHQARQAHASAQQATDKA